MSPKSSHPIGSQIQEFGCHFGIWPATVTGHGRGEMVHVLVHVPNNAGDIVNIPYSFDARRGPDVRPPEARREPLKPRQERHRQTVSYFVGRSPLDPMFERVNPEGTHARVRTRARRPADYDNKAGLPWTDVRGRYWPIIAEPVK